MPKMEDVSVETIQEFLSYEPKNGLIYWAKSPARNVYAGELAGCNKATRKDKNGNLVSYGYIRIAGQNIPSARIAWVLLNGEWPKGRIKFNDSDPLNLRADNLSQSNALSQDYDHSDRAERLDYYKEHRKAYKTDYKDGDLKRRFGIGLYEYSQMLVAQNGKCAICNSSDAGHRNGEPKALAVDHCHTTGKVRGLLCEACNQGIGKLKEDVKILQSAIEYLSKNSSGSPAEDLGTPVTQTGLADAAQTV